MPEFESIDISLVEERPIPTIRFLVLENYVEPIKREIRSLSKEEEIAKFVSTETWPAEIKKNPDGWFEFLLTIDWTSVIKAIGLVSGLIRIGSFLHKLFKFLKRRRNRKEVKKLKMNCTASIALAIKHLRGIRARIKQNEIKLIYLSKVLAYHCIAIFASPITDPKQLHVITVHIDGNVSSYNLVAL